MNNYKLEKALTLSFIFAFIFAGQSYAFIGGPPITTYSIAIILTNLWLFALSFSASIIFQGWFMSKQHKEIGQLEATLQSLKMKAYFLIYALPILILSDISGISLIMLIDKVPLLNTLNKFPFVLGTIYFVIGLTVITLIVGKIENYLFTKKWKKLNINNFCKTVYIANTVIFAFALVIIVVFE